MNDVENNVHYSSDSIEYLKSVFFQSILFLSKSDFNSKPNKICSDIEFEQVVVHNRSYELVIKETIEFIAISLLL